MVRKPRSEFIYSVCTRCGRDKTPGLASWCYRCVYDRRKERERLAKDVMGGRCVRCGITEPLVWDHINDDGRKHNRRTSSGNYARTAIWKEHSRIIETGTSDVLQLLCANCNTLKSIDRASYERAPTYGPIGGDV